MRPLFFMKKKLPFQQLVAVAMKQTIDTNKKEQALHFDELQRVFPDAQFALIAHAKNEPAHVHVNIRGAVPQPDISMVTRLIAVDANDTKKAVSFAGRVTITVQELRS